MEGFPGGFICREALIWFVYEESWFWHVLAFQVLEGFLFCCQSAGTGLFVMMRVIQWSLVGMIETNLLNSPLIRSQDGVVDLYIMFQ